MRMLPRTLKSVFTWKINTQKTEESTLNRSNDSEVLIKTHQGQPLRLLNHNLEILPHETGHGPFWPYLMWWIYSRSTKRILDRAACMPNIWLLYSWIMGEHHIQKLQYSSILNFITSVTRTSGFEFQFFFKSIPRHTASQAGIHLFDL